MIKFNRHLSGKLSLNIMLMAATVFVLSLGIFYFRSRHLIRKEATERCNGVLRTTILQVDNYLNTIEVSTNTNVWLLEDHFTPDSLLTLSRGIVESNPDILKCTVCAEPNMFPQYGRYFSAYTVNEGGTIISAREKDFVYTDKAVQRAFGGNHRPQRSRRHLLPSTQF